MEDIKRTLPEGLHWAGYDREEEYFYRQNRELIERLHAELQAQGAAGSRAAQHAARRLVEQGMDEHPWHATLKRVLDRALKPLPTGIGQFPV